MSDGFMLITYQLHRNSFFDLLNNIFIIFLAFTHKKQLHLEMYLQSSYTYNAVKYIAYRYPRSKTWWTDKILGRQIDFETARITTVLYILLNFQIFRIPT